MPRLLTVSNRLPITIEKRRNLLRFRQSVGGLATAVSSFQESYDSAWIGWCGTPLDRLEREEKEEIETRLVADFNSYPVHLSRRDVDMYYRGFCNRTIWPLFHCFTQYAVYERDLWESYRRVNELFCDTVMEVAEPGDIVWIHDYQLMLLPGLVRQRMPDATIGFFLHIPFPPFEILRLLPWREDILRGLLEADLIGFHTFDYVRHFLESVSGLLGYEHTLGQISVGNRVVRAEAFPMGIDYGRFAGAADDANVHREVERIRRRIGERKIVISIDRLDYTKGILQRLEAFDLFLEKNPEYIGEVTLILVAVPSRTGVEHYRMLKKQVDELVGKINGEHGTLGWMPVWYLYRFLPFDSLVPLYIVADVALVTPLKDGMNLIAKEFIATKTDGKGVLILSEMAGAARELGEAIIVSPHNREMILDALVEALNMPEEEQIERNRTMQRRLQRYDIARWSRDFLEGLLHTKALQQDLAARRLTDEARRVLVDDYLRSGSRLLLLDYDGTLVPFSERPDRASPDDALLALLRDLADRPRTELVIVSGRGRGILDLWFKDLDVALVGEHGAWVKERSGEWETIEPLNNAWKEEIRPILEIHVDRTPGSFIEEKEFSLVWHCRRVDPQLASVRGRELKETLTHLTASLDIGVLEGSKVIEIKSAGINKGRAALRWITRQKWDFILAAGDDRTDEDVFGVLPRDAYSVNVGLRPSKARFSLDSRAEVIDLLRELAR
ncbi:trehalose-6-phosphate synthase [candidate division TA06 bacterium SM23_40]|uniref:Alpha,alpha-trehalose-phosphate synthase n=1 Tax=candidate division TA06 bacterium SM23_40 TaxID=1703774 RepID=A0A0S8G6N7_UNCT6|nr:MAG: trehalose-6-phosphate synthase [candidate division TA06 bacterium SM23_40]